MPLPVVIVSSPLPPSTVNASSPEAPEHGEVVVAAFEEHRDCAERAPIEALIRRAVVVEVDVERVGIAAPSEIVMLSGPLVPVIVSVSFATDAEGDANADGDAGAGADGAVAVDPVGAGALDGIAAAVPAAPKLTANAAADARLN